jgi:hypothetical protein
VEDGRAELAEDLTAEGLGAIVPFGGAIGKRIARSISEEWQRNRSKALRAAEDASGLSREDFAEWAEREPRAIPLYLKVLWAAGMNGHDQTLKALGAVLGQAAKATQRGDEGAFEDAELALRAMAELGPRHFKVLEVLQRGVVTSAGKDGSGVYTQFTPKYVAQQAKLGEDVAHQCLINLAGAGLATTLSVLGGMAYPITDLGRAVLSAAEAATEV